MSGNTRSLVIAVGGGPAGGAAALHLVRQGVGDVTILEKRVQAYDKPCGGGLSAAACRELARLDLLPAVREQAHEIRSAHIVTAGRAPVMSGGFTP
jgi:2-polyprenyl-6-methoxyphenol hydroxylase-like FAD-dependent oxidoreductase